MNRKLVVLAWLALMLAGCSRTHSELGGDSSTHWLRSCHADAQCGGLSCVCGVCSKECGRDKQCAGLGARASCVPSADGCGEVQLCDYECSDTLDCAGDDVVCLDGRCRKSGLSALGGTEEEDGGSSLQPDAGELMSLADGGSTRVDAASEAGSAGSATSCAPQRAASNGTECLRLLGFSWNGAACEEVNCGCEGSDCAALFSSKEACEEAYATCLNPETQCSGLPWYQCFDHCPRDLRLVAVKRDLGDCSGDCSFTLSFVADTPEGGSCLNARAEMLIENTQLGQRVVWSELSNAAWQELFLLSRAIEGLPLERGDCPDCAPGTGTITIVRKNSETGMEEEFSYPAHRRPLELRAVHSFMQGVMDQATVCRGDKLKSCRVDHLNNSLPLPACGDGQRFAEGSCTCGLGLEQLSTLEGTPCSESCPYCGPPGPTCGAVCTLPCAGGPTVWKFVCPPRLAQ